MVGIGAGIIAGLAKLGTVAKAAKGASLAAKGIKAASTAAKAIKGAEGLSTATKVAKGLSKGAEVIKAPKVANALAKSSEFVAENADTIDKGVDMAKKVKDSGAISQEGSQEPIKETPIVTPEPVKYQQSQTDKDAIQRLRDMNRRSKI